MFDDNGHVDDDHAHFHRPLNGKWETREAARNAHVTCRTESPRSLEITFKSGLEVVFGYLKINTI